MSGPSLEASSIPVPLTHFIGRSREISYLGDLLEQRRLVTVAGGSGKTRVAIEAVSAFRGESGWIDLAAIQNPDQIPEHVAAALGVRQEGGIPTERLLLDALQSRQ